jgi:hypothetical protein
VFWGLRFDLGLISFKFGGSLINIVLCVILIFVPCTFHCSMVAAFGSGAMFSIVSGMGGPNLAGNAVTSGLFFALVQGGLFKVSIKRKEFIISRVVQVLQ